MTIHQLLSEIRARSGRPHKQMKDDLALLLDMVEIALDALDYCADNVNPITNGALTQKFLAMRAASKQAREEMAMKGKGE